MKSRELKDEAPKAGWFLWFDNWGRARRGLQRSNTEKSTLNSQHQLWAIRGIIRKGSRGVLQRLGVSCGVLTPRDGVDNSLAKGGHT